MGEPTLDDVLNAEHIGSEAKELAKKLVHVQKTDSNIDSISFFYGFQKGLPHHSTHDQYLIADVELKKPFQDIDAFKQYLQENNLPSENITIEYENPLKAGFYCKQLTDNAFAANFYQPYRIRAKED